MDMKAKKLNSTNFHSTDSDAATSSLMRRMKSGDTGPNSSPSVNLQSSVGRMPNVRGEGNTPNSSPSDTNSGMNYGQKLVTGYPDTPAVTPLPGIPTRDPNMGGASELQKGAMDYGFTTASPSQGGAKMGRRSMT